MRARVSLCPPRARSALVGVPALIATWLPQHRPGDRVTAQQRYVAWLERHARKRPRDQRRARRRLDLSRGVSSAGLRGSLGPVAVGRAGDSRSAPARGPARREGLDGRDRRRGRSARACGWLRTSSRPALRRSIPRLVARVEFDDRDVRDVRARPREPVRPARRSAARPSSALAKKIADGEARTRTRSTSISTTSRPTPKSSTTCARSAATPTRSSITRATSAPTVARRSW